MVNSYLFIPSFKAIIINDFNSGNYRKMGTVVTVKFKLTIHVNSSKKISLNNKNIYLFQFYNVFVHNFGSVW